MPFIQRLRQRLWLLHVLILVFGFAPPAEADPGRGPTPTLIFLDDFNVPTDTPFDSVGREARRAVRGKQGLTKAQSIDDKLRGKASGEFGGISAIAYDGSSRLLALSDTAKPVLFTFRLSMDEDSIELLPERQIPLTDRNGTPLADWSMDPEGLALCPQGTLLIASEGFTTGIPRARVAPTNPALNELDRNGHLLRSIAVPPKVIGLADDAQGTHRNKGLESLTVSPSGKRMFLAAEGSLRQDGPPPNLQNGSKIRIFEHVFKPGSIALQHEYIYPIEAPPTPDGFRNPIGSRGLSELLALGDRELLALERSFVREGVADSGTQRSEQRVEIYHVDLKSASDVTGVNSLNGTTSDTHRPARKTLVLDLRDLIPLLDAKYRSLDNFEGMCLGPQLEDGSPTVILVSDNNFNPTQRTVFLAFKLVVK